ncbi:MAG TPA: SDR family oxidoreductase [Thermoanaerobaculia bacterium]|nr:SDR family oxidoreductase [Thermoanaerobaculia bacterium]
MILVVGATGHLGGLIARRLLAEGRQVRALVREGSDGTKLARAGAQIAGGDMKDPSSLEAACGGVTTVVTTANSVSRGGADNIDSVDLQGNIHLIDAAAKAGVHRFIFVSAAAVDPASPVPLFAAKAKAEEHLRQSGMEWTIIAPHVFMDVWFPMIVGGAVRDGRPVPLVSGGKSRHSFIAAEDVAAFTSAAVDHPAARNQRILLGRPAAAARSGHRFHDGRTRTAGRHHPDGRDDEDLRRRPHVGRSLPPPHVRLMADAIPRLGQQAIDVERLADYAADGETGQFMRIAAAQQIGVRQHGAVRAPQLIDHADAVETRHPDVEKDDVIIAVGEKRDRLAAVARRRHLVACPLQHQAHEAPDIGLIIDNEYSPLHRFLLRLDR